MTSLRSCAAAWMVVSLVSCAYHERVFYRPVPPSGRAELDLPVGIEQVDRCWSIFDNTDALLTADFYVGTGDPPRGKRGLGNLTTMTGEGVDARGHVLGRHDARLFPGAYYLGQSSEYVDDDGVGLPFSAEYVVRVTPVSDERVHVRVEPLLYSVYAGWRSTLAHGPQENIEKDVPSSHWDDNRVLLCLAACLGVEKPLLSSMTPPHIDRNVDWLRPCRPRPWPGGPPPFVKKGASQ